MDDRSHFTKEYLERARLELLIDFLENIEDNAGYLSYILERSDFKYTKPSDVGNFIIRIRYRDADPQEVTETLKTKFGISPRIAKKICAEYRKKSTFTWIDELDKDVLLSNEIWPDFEHKMLKFLFYEALEQLLDGEEFIENEELLQNYIDTSEVRFIGIQHDINHDELRDYFAVEGRDLIEQYKVTQHYKDVIDSNVPQSYIRSLRCRKALSFTDKLSQYLFVSGLVGLFREIGDVQFVDIIESTLNESQFKYRKPSDWQKFKIRQAKTSKPSREVLIADLERFGITQTEADLMYVDYCSSSNFLSVQQNAHTARIVEQMKLLDESNRDQTMPFQGALFHGDAIDNYFWTSFIAVVSYLRQWAGAIKNKEQSKLILDALNEICWDCDEHMAPILEIFEDPKYNKLRVSQFAEHVDPRLLKSLPPLEMKLDVDNWIKEHISAIRVLVELLCPSMQATPSIVLDSKQFATAEEANSYYKKKKIAAHVIQCGTRVEFSKYAPGNRVTIDNLGHIPEFLRKDLHDVKDESLIGESITAHRYTLNLERVDDETMKKSIIQKYKGLQPYHSDDKIKETVDQIRYTAEELKKLRLKEFTDSKSGLPMYVDLM